MDFLHTTVAILIRSFDVQGSLTVKLNCLNCPVQDHSLEITLMWWIPLAKTHGADNRILALKARFRVFFFVTTEGTT